MVTTVSWESWPDVETSRGPGVSGGFCLRLDAEVGEATVFCVREPGQLRRGSKGDYDDLALGQLLEAVEGEQSRVRREM